jgi:hypothetical protein
MFKSPEDKKQRSLLRITRNDCFFCAVFYKTDPLRIKAIYRVPVSKILEETERQLTASSNDISHIGFTIKWVSENGDKVYEDL